MNYLVVSDNHGDRQILVDLLEKYQGQIDYFFHCGDSELPSDDPLFQTFQVVTGNCDFDPGFVKRVFVETPLDRIYMTHGHLSNVKFGLQQLAYEAAEYDANLILFGHTHQLGCEMIEHRLYLNPGSISQPRGPIQIPTYAIVTSTEQQFQVQYYNRNFQPQTDLAFIFEK